MIDQCVAYAWPPYRGETVEFRTTARGRVPAARDERWLDLIVSGMPRAAEPRIDTYLSVLEMALLDGFLAEHEKRALVGVAKEQGLSRGQVMDIHSDYLRAMAEVAWADGIVTPKERADLELVARLLSLPSADVDVALTAAAHTMGTHGSSAVEMFATAGLHLQSGDRICLTGDMKLERQVWEGRARSSDRRCVHPDRRDPRTHLI